ncbi:MAG: Uma2 family endonuclease [Bryobacteraceae bacterium]|nr:Uma2 family endonuclease [Bryobacteraceae bacterium]
MALPHVVSRPLITGERMDLERFIARWDALPGLKNAELIEGVVYVPSPVSLDHGLTDGLVHCVLGYYALHTVGCRFCANGSWSMLGSMPQPDAALYLEPKYGGQSRVRGKYPDGAPELAVEICLTSTEVDFGPKLALYGRAGVQEYVTVELLPQPKIVWRRLVGASYTETPADGEGIHRSQVFPGLWLNEPAFFQSDSDALLATARAGIESPEYVRFRERLASALGK